VSSRAATSDGTSQTAKSGCSSSSTASVTQAVITDRITAVGPGRGRSGQRGPLFVTNVLNGTRGHWGQQVNKANVVRIKLAVTSRPPDQSAVIVASACR